MELLCEEINPAARVSVVIQFWGERAAPQNVWNHDKNTTRNPGFGGETNFERKFSRIIVHTARVHHAKAVGDSFWLQNLNVTGNVVHVHLLIIMLKQLSP